MKEYLTGIAMVLALSGCYYDNEEELYPAGSGGCDTLAVTYPARIKPILENRCYGCHSQQNAPSGGSGYNLEDPATIQQFVSNGRLLGAINHQSGFSPMPKGMPKLPDCEIKAIKTWIDNGAPLN